jgi:DNA-binding response OmpR family regulator
MTNATAVRRSAPKPRVLIVEDEPPIRELVRFHLTLAGFDAVELGDGAAALERGRAEAFDLILLDIMLPGLDGITVCRALRVEGANVATPILMVTARGTESDTVFGLESGADDYLAKPFGVRELVARAGALLRRQERLERSITDVRQLTRRELTVDAEKRQARLHGEAIDLTRQEFDLLYLLCGNPGIVFSRQALLARVWGGDTYVTERTVDTVMSRLRRKVETDPQDPALLLTAWGVGYKFVDEA